MIRFYCGGYWKQRRTTKKTEFLKHQDSQPAVLTADACFTYALLMLYLLQVLLRRILETKAYYNKTEFLKHQDKTETLMSQMCKYPNQVSSKSSICQQ